MGLGGVLRNIWKRGLKDVSDPERIKMYLEGNDIKKNGIHLDYEEIIPFCENVVMRLHQEGCKECVVLGECTHCSCSLPNAFFVKDFYDSGGHFEAMPTQTIKKDFEGPTGLITAEYKVVDAKAWEQKKEEEGITFTINKN